MSRILKPWFNDPAMLPEERESLENKYGDRIRSIVSVQVPLQCLDWEFHLIVGVRELEPDQIAAVKDFVKKIGQEKPHSVVITGVNGHTNTAVVEAAQYYKLTCWLRIEPNMRGLDPTNLMHGERISAATMDADMLSLGMADRITVFCRKGKSSGSLAMLSSARGTFHKRPQKIEFER